MEWRKKAQWVSPLPLFQLYSFLTSNSPLGLNGPFSENAPTPREEQPGPANQTTKIHHPNISLQKCLAMSLCLVTEKIISSPKTELNQTKNDLTRLKWVKDVVSFDPKKWKRWHKPMSSPHSCISTETKQIMSGEKQTSIQPENKRLDSWICFSFSEVVKQSSLLLLINSHIAWILLETHLGLTW